MGAHAAIFMWKDEKACRFLGGKLTYQTKHTCKVGKPHQWKRVVRCVKGAVISHKGLDYKTGMAHVSSNVGAAAIAEAGKAGQANDYFQLGQLKTGKFKGMYIFQIKGPFKELMGAMGGVDRLGGWLTHEKPKMQAY